MKKLYLYNNEFAFINHTLKGDVVFHVPCHMTKCEIKNYIETIYLVKVSSVRTILMSGKRKRNKHSFYQKKKYKRAILSIFKENVSI